MAPDKKKETIHRLASALEIDVVRFCDPELPPQNGQRFLEFIEEEKYGDMHWLAERKSLRVSPKTLWPQAQTAIVAGMNYGPDCDPLIGLEHRSNGVISVYAQNKDYHDVFKKRLKRLAREIVEQFGGELKVFVDTAPVMEKPLAAQSGIGWQGKHTNLVSREFGSWLFLGVILTTVPIDADIAEEDHCGSCQKCLDICPTQAFDGPFKLDAKKCISYLTIEHKGPIPFEFREPIGNHIYGCDDCLAVCPWNKFAQQSTHMAFQPREDLRAPTLKKLASLEDRSFRQFFSGSPIKRTGRNRFVRNVLMAIGNSSDHSLQSTAEALLRDESELVAGAAVWAYCKLSDKRARREKYEEMADYTNSSQIEKEWRYWLDA